MHKNMLLSQSVKQYEPSSKISPSQPTSTTIRFTESPKRIAVIGGGWAGIYALKITREDGHKSVLFERSGDIGGVWRYRENEPGGVWRNVYAVSSKTYLHASDFPFPDEYPLFPHHSHILSHIKNYTDHFDLWPDICLNHEIEQVEKQGSEWVLTVRHGDLVQEKRFDALIVCVGQAQNPTYPPEKIHGNFSGCKLHSHEYKYPTPDMIGKNILVWGGGESGSDIADEVCTVANRVHMSVRRGRWFQPRHTGVRFALDTRNPRKARIMMSTRWTYRLAVKIYEVVSAINYGDGGHGLVEWKPQVPMLSGIVNKSRDVLDKIALGKVVPHRDVAKINGQLVWFEGQTEPVQIDMIIFATGFVRTIPFLPDFCPTDSYKLVFDRRDPTLAYVGSARPVFGSIPALAELQARWVSAVFNGRCPLPSPAAQEQEMVAEREKRKEQFPIDHERLPQLVDLFEYADFITKQLNAQQNFWHLFFTDYKKWKVLMSAPWTPFEVLLNDPVKGEEAYKNIQKEYLIKKNAAGPSLTNFLLFVVFLSLLSTVLIIYLLIQSIILLFI